MPKRGTRERILAIALRLFVSQGYTNTSIADIAGELGTTTAALYYHFPSKADILEAALAGPLAAYARICEATTRSRLPVDELLNIYLDLMIESRDVIGLANDAAVMAIIAPRFPCSPDEMKRTVVARLGGRVGDRASMIRAEAALGVLKEVTLALLADDPSALSPVDRAEILAAARRALDRPPTRTTTS